ncbi:MAG: response regulator [Rickettsiales bacterium]
MQSDESTRILVVDDSKVIRNILRDMLKKLGFERLDFAENGAEALDACRTGMPDVIFLDWNMPTMNGMEFMHNFRAETFKHKAKVVFCTTENDCVKIMQAIESGADEYIMKPFDADMVRAKLAAVGIDVPLGDDGAGHA